MHEDPLIREANSDDIEAVTSLYLELRAHHGTLAPQNPRYHVAEARWRELTEAAIKGTGYVVLVVEHEENVIGCAKFSYADKPWGLSCEIDTLIVAQTVRASGIGRRLMAAIEEHAKSRGARGMRVDVLKENEDGRRFYEALGYRPAAIRYMRQL